MNSITKRWVRGSLLITLLVLLVAEGLFLYFTLTGYYYSCRQAITAQLENLSTQLSTSAQKSDLQMRRLVEQFDAKDQFELMLVDENGRIVISSSGFLPAEDTVPYDVQQVLQPGGTEIGETMGKTADTNETVMAVTMKTPYNSNGIVAMRIVTSLTEVQKTVLWLILGSVVLLLVVVLASVVSGMYFIRSIVMPLQKVEATASHIAAGDLSIRIDNNSNDEIGSLCKTINNMAEELGKSEKMKNEFISSVSHELRTPLTSIKGWTETISHIADHNDANFRRGVGVISAETDRLYSMVEELLDFSRIQNDFTLQCEVLDLAAEVEDAVLLVEPRAFNLHIAIEYTAPELPVPVFADKNRIRQVMVNVLDNAFKYSSAGQIVRIELLTGSGNAFIIISDEGQGIAPEDLENVKVKFYKGQGAVRGSGIGLAVVDEIMKAHEGALELTSELGKGTQVTLRLPLHQYNTEKPKPEQ